MDTFEPFWLNFGPILGSIAFNWDHFRFNNALALVHGLASAMVLRLALPLAITLALGLALALALNIGPWSWPWPLAWLWPYRKELPDKEQLDAQGGVKHLMKMSEPKPYVFEGSSPWTPRRHRFVAGW